MKDLNGDEIERNYEIVTAPTAARSEADYSRDASRALRELLGSGECREAPYQTLLENYPILLPATDPIIDAGQNGFFPGVITQPPLSGLRAKIPDFAVISWDSGTLYIALIEIESPCKNWSTRNGDPTAELSHAIQQLRDWQIWFDDPANATRFRDDYLIPDYLWRRRRLEIRPILIYGRRSELEASNFQRKRSMLQRPNEVFMTWDRLVPNRGLPDPLVVRLTSHGYVAHLVPPTVTLGPFSARDHVVVQGKETAVLQSQLIPEERRRFMADRWPYWDNWAREHGAKGQTLSFEDVGDRE